MTEKFDFGRSFLDYFQDRVDRAHDGTRVPGLDVAAQLVGRLGIRGGQRVLDVGCSFGRLLPVLRPLSDAIYGLEPSYDVVDVAAKEDYRCVVRGGGEDTNFPSSYFDHVVIFGTFDCCDQAATLRETRRVLVPGGMALITGKNDHYYPDDRLAILAERNAWRKDYPNSFTRASNMREIVREYGLDLVEMVRFPRRGDFGEMSMVPDDAASDSLFYEYAAIVRAQDSVPRSGAAAETVSCPISRTAKAVATKEGFAAVEDFFSSDRLD